MTVALITIAVILVAYGAVSKPLDRRGVTSAMVFTAAGLAVGTAGLGLVDVKLETSSPNGSPSSPSSSCCSATRRGSIWAACAATWAGRAASC